MAGWPSNKRSETKQTAHEMTIFNKPIVATHTDYLHGTLTLRNYLRLNPISLTPQGVNVDKIFSDLGLRQF